MANNILYIVVPCYNEEQVLPDTSKTLESILKVTYGCMVYQEQVMQIVRDLAGYSLGRADLVRRAMGKKKLDIMAKERENFIHVGIVYFVAKLLNYLFIGCSFRRKPP